MRSLAYALTSLALGLAACHSHDDAEGATFLNDASDEVLVMLQDLEAQGLIMTNDARAATLSAPADGAMLPEGSFPTFSWAVPQASPRQPRHGTASGTFVWLKITAEGMSPLNVLAVGNVTSWTPDMDDWTHILDASGAI